MSLYGLESGEFYDEPLAVRVYGKRLDNTNKVENDDLFTIGRVVNAGRDKKIAFSERRFVRGVALWTGGEKDTKERKMKGLKLFYATVSTAGVVDAEDKDGHRVGARLLPGRRARVREARDVLTHPATGLPPWPVPREAPPQCAAPCLQDARSSTCPVAIEHPNHVADAKVSGGDFAGLQRDRDRDRVNVRRPVTERSESLRRCRCACAARYRASACSPCRGSSLRSSQAET